MQTIETITKAYKDSPVLSAIKEIYASATTGDLDAINKILASYEGHGALSDLGDAAKAGFKACPATIDDESLREQLETTLLSFQVAKLRAQLL